MATRSGSPVSLTLLTAIAPLVWGTSYIVSTELLPPGRPLFGAAVRALPAGLVAVAVARQLPRGDWWWRVAVLGTLNIGAFFALLFVAAYRLPGVSGRRWAASRRCWWPGSATCCWQTPRPGGGWAGASPGSPGWR